MADGKGFSGVLQWVFPIIAVIALVLSLWQAWPDIKAKAEAVKQG